jgi:peptide/nickel transport system permease protein
MTSPPRLRLTLGRYGMFAADWFLAGHVPGARSSPPFLPTTTPTRLTWTPCSAPPAWNTPWHRRPGPRRHGPPAPRGRVSLWSGFVSVGLSWPSARSWGSSPAISAAVGRGVMRGWTLCCVSRLFPDPAASPSRTVSLNIMVSPPDLLVGVARLVRAETLTQRAANSSWPAGWPAPHHAHLFPPHLLLPNAVAPVLESATLGVAGHPGGVVLEFPRARVQPPTPSGATCSWGNDVRRTRLAVDLSAWPSF